jgi:hypothetical protein
MSQTATTKKMQWTSGEVLVLANQRCAICFGLGTREARGNKRAVCQCVYRAVFRGCLEKFRTCALKEKYISRLSLAVNPSNSGRRARRSSYGFKNEEYMADFVLASRRELTPDSTQYAIFTFHFLYGANWDVCVEHLARRGVRMTRGDFFHEVYRIEAKLGRALGSLEPHALYPTDQYFNSQPGRAAQAPAELSPAVEDRAPAPRLKFPLQARGAGETIL